MKRLSVTIAALLSVCVPPAVAAPQRWALVTRTERVAIYIDTRSIVSKDGVVRAWEKWEYTSDRPGTYATDHRPYRSAQFLSHYDCLQRTSAEMQTVYYDAAGEVVGKVTEDPKTARLTYVVPGLLSESTLNFVCKPRAPAKRKKS
jgi:Surface-adhesin protein E